jgi:hypothetical protein
MAAPAGTFGQWQSLPFPVRLAAIFLGGMALIWLTRWLGGVDLGDLLPDVAREEQHPGDVSREKPLHERAASRGWSNVPLNAHRTPGWFDRSG